MKNSFYSSISIFPLTPFLFFLSLFINFGERRVKEEGEEMERKIREMMKEVEGELGRRGGERRRVE